MVDSVDKVSIRPSELSLDLRAPSSLARIIFHGQSLSLGFIGLPILSRPPTQLGYSFAHGVRCADSFFYENRDGVMDPFTKLAPLQERELDAFGAGELVRYQAEGYSPPLHSWAPIFEFLLK